VQYPCQRQVYTKRQLRSMRNHTKCSHAVVSLLELSLIKQADTRSGFQSFRLFPVASFLIIGPVDEYDWAVLSSCNRVATSPDSRPISLRDCGIPPEGTSVQSLGLANWSGAP
jgi:hypothetical protein